MKAENSGKRYSRPTSRGVIATKISKEPYFIGIDNTKRKNRLGMGE